MINLDKIYIIFIRILGPMKPGKFKEMKISIVEFRINGFVNLPLSSSSTTILDL